MSPLVSMTSLPNRIEPLAFIGRVCGRRLVSAKQYQRRAKQGPRVSMVYTLLNAYCTVGIDAPTDGDRVGCGPQVGYLGFNIPDGTDLPVG